MKTWQKIALGLLTACGVALQLLDAHGSHAHAWDAVPGFYALYGFAGCILIIVVSKALGKWALQKREDYYDD